MSAAHPAPPAAVPAEAAEPFDPYRLDPRDVAEPPRTLAQSFRRIGPGMVLAASIVGSGELIATTTLGAQVGYAALWIIVLSCLIKPVVQAELGRFTIATGQTGLEALDLVPGPRLRAGWVLWAWAAMVLVTMLQVGGMYGGVSQVMHLLVPAVPIRGWVFVFLALSLALLMGGGYARVERLAFVKVGLFTMLTVLAAAILVRMPRYFSWGGVADGLRLELPAAGLATAVAVFGITGVGASELFMYPYWCVEKGYARFTGPADGSADWQRRARGWIRVMHVDIVASMVIYTVATVAFFLLGAGVLHGMGLVPASRDMIPVLSNIYTQTLGGWALWLFYAGALATLYGTIFASTAAQTRMFADMCRILGYFAREDARRRRRFRQGFVFLLTVLPVGLYLFLESPVAMVVAGGIAQAVMLPVLGLSAVYLRHRRLPASVRPSAWTTAALW
ncbi:MAG TPA: Nramp family divalent metal transporter, partial [Vicinamibacteria bacterium]